MQFACDNEKNKILESHILLFMLIKYPYGLIVSIICRSDKHAPVLTTLYIMLEDV